MLEQTPGLNIDEIAAWLGLRRTAANHHLRILLRTGAIVRVRQAGHQLHFVSSTGRFEREALCALRVPSVRDVVRRLHEGERPSSSALASSLHITGRTARRALRLLVARQLLQIDKQPDGAKVAHLHPTLRILMAREVRPAIHPPNGAPDAPADQAESLP